jgi:hypothetical protein
MERDLLGEIPEYKHEVVKIAEEAAKKRRPQYLTQPLIGPVENHRGYAVYDDFKRYIRKQVLAGGSEVKVKGDILKILCDAGWDYLPIPHGKTRFYEPSREAVK